MPPIPKKLEHFFLFPNHRKSLAKVNRMFSKFYNQLPANAALEFDKLYPEIIRLLSTGYADKFNNPTPEFAFDIFMVTACLASEKKEKLKTPRLVKNLDILHKQALEFMNKTRQKKH